MNEHDKLKERITEIIHSGGVKHYMAQVLAESIMDHLHNEGLLRKHPNPNRKKGEMPEED